MSSVPNIVVTSEEAAPAVEAGVEFEAEVDAEFEDYVAEELAGGA